MSSGDGLATVYVRESDKIYYVHKDHLGSIVKLTDGNGTTVFKASYDVWGKQTVTNNTFAFHRGYTGHEHLNEFGLINMNGRMYDPNVGRFLSPDPFVQAPDFSQSFNRYSYCLNNPLIYTDPSGELFVIDDFIFAMAVGAIINTTIQGMAGNINSAGGFWKAMGLGALSGAAGYGAGSWVSGAISFGGFAGGSLTGAAGGFAGGFVGGAGNAWAYGSNFASGLKTGLVSGGIGGLAGGLIGGVTRGISDYRNGYSFWDGTKIINEQIISGSAQGNIATHYNNSGLQANINDEVLQERVYEEFGVRKGDMQLSNITTKTNKGYGMTNDGKYINLKSNNLVAGYTRASARGYTEMHISPYSTYADGVNFRATVGHELVHVYHHSIIPSSIYNSIYSERVACKYTYEVYMNNGYYSNAMDVMNLATKNSYWGSFPSRYNLVGPYRFFNPR